MKFMMKLDYDGLIIFNYYLLPYL